ncbi:MAG: DNA polymerase III subunit beta [Planctomycetia bacterium]|nr:DNA polymerase III subunit beta [Planctomycetia bacterium]
MKIRCSFEKFTPMFTLISSFVSSRSDRQLLMNVKLIADEKNILLLASGDDNASARGEIEVGEDIVVEKPGEVILPTQIIKRLLNVAGASEFTLETEGKRLNVSGQEFSYQLDTLEPEDFPVAENFEETAYHKIAASDFRELVRRTAFATAVGEFGGQFALDGVLIELLEDRAVAVATDGRRLANYERPAEAVGGHKVEGTAVFPTKLLNLLDRVCADQEDVKIAVKENRVLVQSGSVVVGASLVDGSYPKWRDIMPNKSEMKKIDFLVGQIASAVSKAEIVTTDQKPGVNFAFKPGKCIVSGVGLEIGESQVEMNIAFDDCADIRLASKYLTDLFKRLDSNETLSFYLNSETIALFETADGYSYIVMPLK